MQRFTSRFRGNARSRDGGWAWFVRPSYPAAVAPQPGRAFYAVSVETLTFLFTDIEGSTALLQRLGESQYAQVLAGHHALVRAGLAAHDGEEVDTQGDAFFAVFSSPTACVAASIEIQRGLAART